MFGFVSESAFSCIDEDLGLCFGAKNERIVVDFFIPSESTSSSALVSGSSGSLRAFFSRSCFRYSFEVKYLVLRMVLVVTFVSVPFGYGKRSISSDTNFMAADTTDPKSMFRINLSTTCVCQG